MRDASTLYLSAESVGILEGYHIKPHVPAEWRWLNANALKRLPQIENEHPRARRLTATRHDAFTQRFVALDQGRIAHEHAIDP